MSSAVSVTTTQGGSSSSSSGSPKGTFVSVGDHQVYRYEWKNLPAEFSRPKLVLHISHGNCESGARYDAFAKYLNSFGIVISEC